MQNRKIEFRGKRIDTGEWVKGYYLERKQPYGSHSMILSVIDSPNEWDDKEEVEYHVDRKTVGQNTGLKDKNSVDVFEGDILKTVEYEWNDYSEESELYDEFISDVVYKRSAFTVKNNKSGTFEEIMFSHDEGESIEIIGNTIDNPELLKQ